MSVKLTIELPDRIAFSNKAQGKLGAIDLAKLPSEMGAKAVLFGLKTTVLNAYNSGGDSHALKAAAMDKRIAAILRGDWEMAERGESAFTAMKEVWIDEFRTTNEGASIADAGRFIGEKVRTVLGEKEKATFANFLKATATELVKADPDLGEVADVVEGLEAHYQAKADERAKLAAKAEAKLVAPTIDLSAFKKAKPAK